MILDGKPSVNEYRITDSQGQVRWLRDSVRPMRDPITGVVGAVMGSVQDITERKQLEEQLLQAQKLEALARLSGGIAHDFNNLLAVVMGSISLLSERAHTDEARACCAAIQEAAERGAELTRSLLVFARRDTGSPRVVNLSDVVRDALPMLVRAVGPHHHVVLEDVEPLSVSIDPGQAQLLLLNLAINARDAMGPGGTIRLSMHELHNVEGSTLPRELSAHAYARLCVTDNGAGIPPEVMPRLFEPFFTTKARGAGTGLGLAACHGIVQHAGGAIHVSSVVGQGSTFSIYLPLSARQESAPDSARVRHSPGGTERILVVEDEKRLQLVLARALRDRGYSVVHADSAEQALAELENAAFDLILSDVVLPGIDGTELVPMVRQRWPHTAIILMSGYPGTAAVPADILLLSKPFTIDRLAMHVRQALDHAATVSDHARGAH
jgi:two-component system cell cycle sensor histidine kinase/response regulator CckA